MGTRLLRRVPWVHCENGKGFRGWGMGLVPSFVWSMEFWKLDIGNLDFPLSPPHFVALSDTLWQDFHFDSQGMELNW